MIYTDVLLITYYLILEQNSVNILILSTKSDLLHNITNITKLILHLFRGHMILTLQNCWKTWNQFERIFVLVDTK